MNPRALFPVLAWGALAGGVAALGQAAGPAVQVAAPLPVEIRALAAGTPAAYPTDSLRRAVVARDPFRAGRRPAQLAYSAERVTASANAPVAPKPVLALVGVVAGHDPTAVIEGLPGTEGARVVRVGDVVSGLRVRSITAQEVRIVGTDTTWVLKVREPWK
jgi:hypothetical protein